MTTQMTGPSGEEPRGEGTRYDIESMAEMLRAAAHQARSDVAQTEDPKAQALLETSAEVLLGLVTAFEHYNEGRESAWR